PTEIIATLDSAKKSYDRRIIAVFQPHLFSRTQLFYREFAEALRRADVCYLVDIFPSREQPIPGVTAEMISKYAETLGYKNIEYIGAKENAAGKVLGQARQGDMIITIGAGSITRVNPEIIKGLRNNVS
ncbi:MAG: cyanophycin synthetase, partial [Candidatus Zixiibacteriota bacterium]